MVDYIKDKKNFFIENDYVVVEDFIDQESISTISKYLQNSIYRGIIKNNKGEEEGAISEYSFYADPLIEVVLANSTESVGEIVGEDLIPTYSFTRIYTNQDELKKHTDRPSCEYSVTVNVNTVGEKWPIWLKNSKGKEIKFTLSPGQALVYKGCDVEHWREKMSLVNCEINVQFMLHYVAANGNFSSYKWDNRDRLGLPANQRRPLCQ